jgi:signal transduction histidine kinase
MRFGQRLVAGAVILLLLAVVALDFALDGAVLPGGLLILIPGALLAWLAGRSITRPLTEAAEAAHAIAAGADPRFPHSGLPDVDQLVGALRNMHEELHARFEALARQQAESAALVNAMVEGVLACDRRGRVVTANPAARRLLGYAPEDALPQLQVLFHQKEAREAVTATLAGAPAADREVELDGRTCLLSARPLPGGGAVVVLHDLTDLRRLEAIRRDFVANVSHELKTPLTSISGYAETLLGEHPPDPDTSRVFLRTILDNARRMHDLVDDQLDLSRIESGSWRPVPERLATRHVLEEAWVGTAGAAREGRHDFRVHLGRGSE